MTIQRALNKPNQTNLSTQEVALVHLPSYSPQTIINQIALTNLPFQGENYPFSAPPIELARKLSLEQSTLQSTRVQKPQVNREELFKDPFFLRVPPDKRTLLIDHLETPYPSSTTGLHHYHHPLQRKMSGEITAEQAAHGILMENMQKIPGSRSYKGSKDCIEVLIKGFSRFTADPEMLTAVTNLSGQLSEKDFEVFSCIVPNSAEMQRLQSENIEPDIGLSEQNFYEFVLINTPFLPRIESLTHYKVFILPPLLFYQLLKNRWPHTAVKPEPVLGYKAVEKLSKCVERVMSLSSDFSPALTAHGSTFKWHSTMYWHDMFHLCIESANPHKEIFAHLALNIKTIVAKTHPACSEELLKQIRNQCLDRDFHQYASNPSQPRSDIFWLHIPRIMWFRNQPEPWISKWNEWTGPNGVGLRVIDYLENYIQDPSLKEGAKVARQTLLFYDPQKNGIHTITHPAGNKYDGTFENGKFIKGTITFPTGPTQRKEGKFWEDEPGDDGDLILKDGTIYRSDGINIKGKWTKNGACQVDP